MNNELSISFFDKQSIQTVCVPANAPADDIGYRIAISVADQGNYRTLFRLDGNRVLAGLQDRPAPVDLRRQSELPCIRGRLTLSSCSSNKDEARE
jgi:hypothetical protein